MIMSFLYKERKRRESTMSGVFKMADYSNVSTTPELREKVEQVVRKQP